VKEIEITYIYVIYNLYIENRIMKPVKNYLNDVGGQRE
jgi:hypothetical protein